MNNRGNQKHVCAICGKEYFGWGNNAWPITGESDGVDDSCRCCDECNMSKVIPARVKMFLKEY